MLESTSNDLLLFYCVDDDQVCPRVQGDAVPASRLPLKIHRKQVIAEVMRGYVREMCRTSGLYNTHKPLLDNHRRRMYQHKPALM